MARFGLQLTIIITVNAKHWPFSGKRLLSEYRQTDRCVSHQHAAFCFVYREQNEKRIQALGNQRRLSSRIQQMPYPLDISFQN